MKKRRMRLGTLKHHTVFEGEGVGLILGLELIREEEEVDGMVLMGIYNTVAISATHAIKLNPSHHIWDLFHQRVAVMYNKHKGADILVKWTPGHMGIIGNEKADEEAKKAAMEGSSSADKLLAPLRKTLPRSRSAAWQEFTWKLKLKAINLWKDLLRFDGMKKLDLKFKHNSFSKLTHNLHLDHASLLFQLRAGHVPLNAYLHKIQKADSPICSSCQYNETVINFILHCETYKEARKMLLQKAGRDARDIGKLLSSRDLLPHLFRFIRNTGRFRIC